MAGTSIARALGLVIETFSDFLQRLFEGVGQTELKDKELVNSLHSKGEITIGQLLKLPISELRPKLDKVDTNLLDGILVLLFEKSNNSSGLKDCENLMNGLTNQQLKTKAVELIEYLNSTRTEFSLERKYPPHQPHIASLEVSS